MTPFIELPPEAQHVLMQLKYDRLAAGQLWPLTQLEIAAAGRGISRIALATGIEQAIASGWLTAHYRRPPEFVSFTIAGHQCITAVPRL